MNSMLKYNIRNTRIKNKKKEKKEKKNKQRTSMVRKQKEIKRKKKLGGRNSTRGLWLCESVNPFFSFNFQHVFTCSGGGFCPGRGEEELEVAAAGLVGLCCFAKRIRNFITLTINFKNHGGIIKVVLQNIADADRKYTLSFTLLAR